MDCESLCCKYSFSEGLFSVQHFRGPPHKQGAAVNFGPDMESSGLFLLRFTHCLSPSLSGWPTNRMNTRKNPAAPPTKTFCRVFLHEKHYASQLLTEFYAQTSATWRVLILKEKRSTAEQGKRSIFEVLPFRCKTKSANVVYQSPLVNG